jgi:hypothetical protein
MLFKITVCLPKANQFLFGLLAAGLWLLARVLKKENVFFLP